MIRRITLENYMSHVRTVIEPAEGLTVLVGPNNCGKSAVIHALEMICYNSDAADFAIRHGEKKATVTVETEDADGARHTLVWWRKKGTAGYVIDGREISRLGRSSIPDDLHQFLRMPETAPSGSNTTFRLHFGLQKAPIFLLDGSASDAAYFFASSSDADKLIAMQRAHVSKTLERRREKERLDGEIAKLSGQLQTLAPLDETGPELAALELEYNAALKRAAELDAMQKRVSELATALDLEDASRGRVQSLAPLHEPPNLHPVEPLDDVICRLSECQASATANEAIGVVLMLLEQMPALHTTADLSLHVRQITEWQSAAAIESARIDALQPLRLPPVPHETADLRRIIDRFALAEQNVEKTLASSSVLQSLAPTPLLNDVAALCHMVEQMEKALEQNGYQTSRREILARTMAPPQLGDPSSISAAIAQFESAESSEKSHRVELNRITKAVADLRQEIEAYVADNPRCQTCGQAVSAELIFSGGHGHE